IAEATAHLADQPLETRRGVEEPLRARLRCQTLGEKYRDRHFDWLRQAAMAGQPEAVYRYATGQAFGYAHGADFSFLRSPDFEVWRREAPPLLESLFEAGYPEAIAPLIVSSDPLMGGYAAALLPSDPVRERAYIHLVVLLAGDAPELQAIAAK